MASFSRGYWTVANVRGVALRVHATLPLGLLFFALVLRSGVILGGLAVIIVAHELGHAALARRYRLPVVSIDVTGIGGACRYVDARATETQEAIIAWGGVLAQAILLAIGELAARTIGLSESLVSVAVFNVLIIVLNILPFRPFDGATAWKLFRWKNVRRWGRRGALNVRAAALDRKIGRAKKENDRWLN